VGDRLMPVKLNSTGGVSVTLTTPSTASDYTATFPANTGNVVTTGSSAVVTQAMLGTNVAGNGPAFGAYQNLATSLTAATSVKILFQVEEFDTNSNFSSSRFTPTVAGYYQLNAALQIDGNQSFSMALFKNGSLFKYGNYVGSTTNFGICVVSSIIYLNGSTDYVEIYGNAAVTVNSLASQAGTYFNGALVRAA